MRNTRRKEIVCFVRRAFLMLTITRWQKRTPERKNKINGKKKKQRKIPDNEVNNYALASRCSPFWLNAKRNQNFFLCFLICWQNESTYKLQWNSSIGKTSDSSSHRHALAFLRKLRLVRFLHWQNNRGFDNRKRIKSVNNKFHEEWINELILLSTGICVFRSHEK